MTSNWVKSPHPAKPYAHDAAALKKQWSRLHRGDCEPVPRSAGALDAWRAFHAGDFAGAVALGRKAGAAATNAACKAQTVYAHYLEPSAKTKLALFEEAATWADERRKAAPEDANAHYLYAFALGRYGQGIS